MAKRKNAAAVALSRLGAEKGGRARAARLTPEQRSESARRAVQARWNKAKKGRTTKAATARPALDYSKKALHLCLDRIKNAKSEIEVQRLTEELQRIVFHKQYENAET